MLIHMAMYDDDCPDSVKRVVLNPDGTVKPVAHFEVGGGPGENPSHIETRFLQAELAMGGPLLDQHLAR